MLCILHILIFRVSRHEEAAILVILLAKSLHCLLLWIGTPLHIAVLRRQAGLRELKRLWPRSTDPLMTRADIRTGEGVLRHIGSVIERKGGKQRSNHRRRARQVV